jgi:hypothetical protein
MQSSLLLRIDELLGFSMRPRAHGFRVEIAPIVNMCAATSWAVVIGIWCWLVRL